jgi:error-prone DNA polymerase
LVRDAKWHGLRVLPACVSNSLYDCTVVDDSTIRLGLNQLQGVGRAAMAHVAEERLKQPWRDLEDFMQRCPLSKKERRILAKAGALNTLSEHRRTALWSVEKECHADLMPDMDIDVAPLSMMSRAERLHADYQATSVTVGPHPMALARSSVPQAVKAIDLPSYKHGEMVSIAGMVICRQRPGTAKGHVFVSLEDESGVSNAFVPSPLFERQRLVITQEPFLQIHGRLQVIDDVITVYAFSAESLIFEAAVAGESHDFH